MNYNILKELFLISDESSYKLRHPNNYDDPTV